MSFMGDVQLNELKTSTGDELLDLTITIGSQTALRQLNAPECRFLADCLSGAADHIESMDANNLRNATLFKRPPDSIGEGIVSWSEGNICVVLAAMAVGFNAELRYRSRVIAAIQKQSREESMTRIEEELSALIDAMHSLTVGR